MKFGKISLLTHNYESINFGDVLQDFACDYLYQCMGINQTDIIEIKYNEVCSYNGEYIVVPIYNAIMDGYFENKNILSPKIIPVFLGFVTDLTILSNEIVSYLRQYEPIGCRDEYTLNLLREYGIRSYIGGCITTILPKRKCEPKKGKVFLTDIPTNLVSFLPKTYLENGISITQMGFFPMEGDLEERRLRIKEAAKKFYKRYEEEASLVITSRLHSTLPCLAMGIPVILVRDEMWKSFKFVDAYTRIFLEGHYNEIDWSPKAFDYESLKSKILQLFIKRIRTTYIDNLQMIEVSEFYEQRVKTATEQDFEYRIELLLNVLNKNVQKNFSYIIWGAGVRGHIVQQKIEKEFPRARFVAYADKSKKGEFSGYRIIPIDNLNNYKDTYIIICNNTGEAEAINKMRELGKLEYKDYYSTNIAHNKP